MANVRILRHDSVRRDEARGERRRPTADAANRGYSRLRKLDANELLDLGDGARPVLLENMPERLRLRRKRDAVVFLDGQALSLVVRYRVVHRFALPARCCSVATQSKVKTKVPCPSVAACKPTLTRA